MSNEKIKTKEEFMEYFDSLNHGEQEAILESMMISVGILTEEAVCKDLSNNIHIGITVDQKRHFELDPYFKVSWKPINEGNPFVARISMRTGDYVVHYGTSVEIPSKIVTKINKMLADSKFLVNDYKDSVNGWDGLLASIAKQTNYAVSLDQLRINFPQIVINPNKATLKGCKITKWGK